MTDYFFEIKEHTFALVDRALSKHIKISIINGSDGSGYLILNSSNPATPDYIKITYHPRSNELIYEFTNEYWGPQKKPNKERKKFTGKPTSPNQTLGMIYVDKSALFRSDKIDKDCTQIIFPEEDATEIKLAFENSRLTVSFRKIPEDSSIKEFIKKSLSQVYKDIPRLKGPVNGCVQALLTGDNLPLRIVLFGV